MSGRAIHAINPNADVISKNHALTINAGAAKGLMNILKTNLGPKGTLKMLVDGSGQIRLTKDGCVLLHQMQIQHPTASLIARTATAQDDITGDGTTSSVLFVGELLRQAERYIQEGLHPRVIVEGFEASRAHCLAFLEQYKLDVSDKTDFDTVDRELLVKVAQTSLRTKLHTELADHLTEVVVDAVLAIRQKDKPIDLHMIEMMHMVHQSDLDTKLIKGLVLDHGARHPNMKKRVENAFILTCNVGLEYEKTEVNSGMFYSSAEQREQMVEAERAHANNKVYKIVDLKNKLCPEGSGKNFVVINQKGIDPISLDILQKNGIVGIRRAKRRNMERLALSCGGFAINSVEDLSEDSLGHADLVYEHQLGEDKYTFIEGVQNPLSVTILAKGPNAHTIGQIKDAIRDGVRACRNVLQDKAVVPGAGAFEIAAHLDLLANLKSKVKGRAKLGVQAFADALLVVPKTLAVNSGLDQQDSIITLLDAAQDNNRIGLDVNTGDVILPEDEGIWDNFSVKKQIIHLASIIATKLLLVDEVMRAGRGGKK